MVKLPFIGSSSVIALAIALVPGVSWTEVRAQASAVTPPGAEAAGSPRAAWSVEDIIVTAQKRSQSVQDVPATVAAFSQATLENRQIQGLSDLTSRVPSLQVGYQFGSNTITLRGISSNLTGGLEDPSVAVHINGVYQARARTLHLALMDLERIEVLSGPQGTLYGRNATGGVINYILQRPTDVMEAEITANVGNYDSYGLRGYISGPISETVGFRIAGLWSNRDKGYLKNLYVGNAPSRLEEDHVAAIRGVLEFNPTETLNISLEGSYANERSSFALSALTPSINPTRAAQLAGYQVIGKRRVTMSDFPDTRVDSKQYAASATVNFEISDNVQLKSITAYQEYRNHQDIDYDASARPGQHVIRAPYRSKTYTQELNLLTSAFDGKLKSTFGIFYYDDRVRNGTDVIADFSRTPDNPPTTLGFVSTNALKAKSLALFTDHTLSITDRLRVLGGIRYNVDKKNTFNTLNFGCAAPTGIRSRQKWDAWTPRAGVQFDVTSKIMAYATYQKGFKVGGVSAGTCGDTYEPENISGFETGIKSEFADGRIRLNVAGYWYKYGNLQVQKTLAFPAGSTQVLNAANSKIKGIEANLDATIVEGLRLDLAGMVQSAKYTDFENCNTAAFFGSCSATDPVKLTEQLKGNWLNRAAPYSVNLGLEYTVNLGDSELILRGESYWSGKVRLDPFNTPVATNGAYSIQNAYVTFKLADDRFRVRVFGKNLANHLYRSTAFFSGTNGQFLTIWSPPRTYGAEVTYKF